MLKNEGEAVADRVVLALLATRRDQARNSFLGHNVGEGLVETELVPLDMQSVNKNENKIVRIN